MSESQANIIAAEHDLALQQNLRSAFAATEDEQGRAHLGAFGSHISNQAPDFDPRHYGYKKLSDLIAARPEFVLESSKSADGKSTSHFVKLRASTKS